MAVRGRPSWNTTPGRSRKTHVLSSGFRHSEARAATTRDSSSNLGEPVVEVGQDRRRQDLVLEVRVEVGVLWTAIRTGFTPSPARRRYRRKGDRDQGRRAPSLRKACQPLPFEPSPVPRVANS